MIISPFGLIKLSIISTRFLVFTKTRVIDNENWDYDNPKSKTGYPVYKYKSALIAKTDANDS